MGFWPRIVATAAVTAAVFAGGWLGIDAAGAGQGAAIAVASIAGTAVITLGGAWALRARGADDPDDAGGTSAVVSRSPSGQAVGQARGPVFGPGSDFAGATITIGMPADHQPAVAPGNTGRVPLPGPAGDRVVVGEIPQEPQAFQDRPDLLAALTGPPGNGRVSVVYAVTGLRGVGKSQLAAACARQRLDDGWPVVAWINAEDREEMLAGYAQLAARLGLAADAPDSAEAARRVRHWLEAGGERCLLVLDNADKADVLRPFLPAAGCSQVIVTSSNAVLAGLGRGVPVDVFTQDQAAGFLAERTGLPDQPGALAIAQELGCLPLALAQAGAVIAGQRLDYPTYLTRLAAVRLGDYLTRPEADPYPRGTAEAITLALDAALHDDPGGLAGRLLSAIALLSPAGAPRALVSGAVDASAEDADAALGRLASWSLVTFSVDGSAVSAHRLVTRVTRERSAAGGSLAEIAGDVVWALGAVLPAQEDAWRYPVLMGEFVTQVTALSGHLDALPGLLSSQSEKDFLGLLAWARRPPAGARPRPPRHPGLPQQSRLRLPVRRAAGRGHHPVRAGTGRR